MTTPRPWRGDRLARPAHAVLALVAKVLALALFAMSPARAQDAQRLEERSPYTTPGAAGEWRWLATPGSLCRAGELGASVTYAAGEIAAVRTVTIEFNALSGHALPAEAPAQLAAGGQEWKLASVPKPRGRLQCKNLAMIRAWQIGHDDFIAAVTAEAPKLVIAGREMDVATGGWDGLRALASRLGEKKP